MPLSPSIDVAVSVLDRAGVWGQMGSWVWFLCFEEMVSSGVDSLDMGKPSGSPVR